MKPSWYFGASASDLYHQDHFMSKLQNVYPQLLRMRSWRFVRHPSQEPDEHGAVTAHVRVTDQFGESDFVFTLQKMQPPNLRRGSWMTAHLQPHS